MQFENDVSLKVKNISYSTLNDYRICPYYFKLKNYDKIRLDGNTVDTIYGSQIHRGSQNILHKNLDPGLAIENYKRFWKKFTGIYESKIDRDKYDINLYMDAGVEILENIKNEFDVFFKNKYKIKNVEENLYIQLEKYSQHFKGYIDLIVELENSKFIIIDFKTCSNKFFFQKYKDKYKDYQLTLYKYFYHKKYGIDLKDIETYFVLLQKQQSKKNGRISFERVTSGQKKIDNCLNWMDNILRNVNKGLWIKNTTNCVTGYGTCLYKKVCDANNKIIL